MLTLNEENSKKVNDFIKSNLMNFVVFVSSFSYIFYGQIGIELTSSSVIILTLSSILAFIFGIIIKQAIGENGITKGYSSNLWKDSFQKYSATCNLANDYLDRIDNFYLYEEIRIKKEYRRKKLMQYRMNYNWFFDKDGNFTENNEKLDKLDKVQLKVLKKCINIKIYTLNLMSEYDSDEEQMTKKETTDKDQRARMLKRNMIINLFTSIVGAYFIPVFNSWNWASLIISTVQVSIWIGCGVLQLYANYNYIVIDKVSKLSKKKEGILRFVNGCKEGLYLHSPYDENCNEISKEIAIVDKSINETTNEPNLGGNEPKTNENNVNILSGVVANG